MFAGWSSLLAATLRIRSWWRGLRPPRHFEANGRFARSVFTSKFERPSDLDGVVFDSISDVAWQKRLGAKLLAAGFELSPSA